MKVLIIQTLRGREKTFQFGKSCLWELSLSLWWVCRYVPMQGPFHCCSGGQQWGVGSRKGTICSSPGRTLLGSPPWPQAKVMETKQWLPGTIWMSWTSISPSLSYSKKRRRASEFLCFLRGEEHHQEDGESQGALGWNVGTQRDRENLRNNGHVGTQNISMQGY